MKHKLLIDISITRDDKFKFAQKGNVIINCPSCRMPIEITSSRLVDDESVTPVIRWEYIKELDNGKTTNVKMSEMRAPLG